MVGSQEPTFDIAKGLTAASALEDTSGAIQQRMSPYMQNVVDIQKEKLNVVLMHEDNNLLLKV